MITEDEQTMYRKKKCQLHCGEVTKISCKNVHEKNFPFHQMNLNICNFCFISISIHT